MQTIPTASAPTLSNLRGRISNFHSSGQLHPSDIPFLAFALSSTCCLCPWPCCEKDDVWTPVPAVQAHSNCPKAITQIHTAGSAAWHCNKRRAQSSRSDYCMARHLWQQQNQKLSDSRQMRAEYPLSNHLPLLPHR